MRVRIRLHVFARPACNVGLSLFRWTRRFSKVRESTIAACWSLVSCLYVLSIYSITCSVRRAKSCSSIFLGFAAIPKRPAAGKRVGANGAKMMKVEKGATLLYPFAEVRLSPWGQSGNWEWDGAPNCAVAVCEGWKNVASNERRKDPGLRLQRGVAVCEDDVSPSK